MWFGVVLVLVLLGVLVCVLFDIGRAKNINRWG
jgi:hypothetical protein